MVSGPVSIFLVLGFFPAFHAWAGKPGGTPPLTVALWDCAIGAVVLLPVLALGGRVLPHGPDEWAVVLALGIVFTGLSTLAYAAILRHVSAQAAGLLTFLEPVSAVVLAAVFLGNPLTAATLLGGSLVVVAGVAVIAFEPEAAPESL